VQVRSVQVRSVQVRSVQVRSVQVRSVGVELLEVVDATTMPMQSQGRDGEKLGKSELVHL